MPKVTPRDPVHTTVHTVLGPVRYKLQYYEYVGEEIGKVYAEALFKLCNPSKKKELKRSFARGDKPLRTIMIFFSKILVFCAISR